MSKQKVLLLGATGETGNSILEGLLEHPSQFDVEALVRPASAEKSSTKRLAERGVTIRIADINGPVEELGPVLNGVDVVISAIDAFGLPSQKNLATAAKQAGVKRFLPCMWSTVTPPGVMPLRDLKEEVITHIRTLYLPYTIVDVGLWYQVAFPGVPSGRLDYAAIFKDRVLHGDGVTARNLYTDERDIGRFVARIIADERTLNRYVVGWGAELTEEEIWSITEEVSGEKIERRYQSHDETLAVIEGAEKAAAADPGNTLCKVGLYSTQYERTMFLRPADNTREAAAYLGYLDARELYPDLRPTSFRDFLSSVLEGKCSRPYVGGDSETSMVLKQMVGGGK